MEETVSLKLVSGEEIIGHNATLFGKSFLEALNEDTIVLKDARTLVMLPNGDLRLAPVIFSADKDKQIIIFTRAISAYSIDIKTEFLEAYNQSLSPLTLPKKEIIMG